jgi:transcriptional regulator with XRE-family HTH domain
MSRIPAGQRPHYLPTERLAILELRAARGWSLAQTAAVFQVTTATVASWTNRLDEQGPAALLRMQQPVNKFPDFIRYIVQRLQTLCPRLGKVKIAQVLGNRSAIPVGRPVRPVTPM